MAAFVKCIVYLVCFQLCYTEGQSQIECGTMMVQESQGNAQVCATITGLPIDIDTPEAFANVTEGSATSEDFMLLNSQAQVISVNGRQTVCAIIEIINDDEVETTESFTVGFTLSRSVENGVSETLATCSVEVLILDDDIGCSDRNFTFSESQSDGELVGVCISIRVAGGSSNVPQVRVEVAADQGNATSGQDFELQDQLAQVDEIEETVLEACATVRIIDNTEFETTVFFTLEYTLRNSDASETLATCSVEVLILDDDIGCSNHLFRFSESEGQPEICVAVNGVPQNDTIISQIGVNVTATEGTATNDDFQLSESAILRSTGEGVQACTTVEIIDDEEVEGNERFTIELTLSRPAIGSLSAATASCSIEVRILDDDIECFSDTVTYSENAGDRTVCVVARGVRRSNSEIAIEVTGNATRGEDFQIFNQTFFVEPQTAMEEVQACTPIEIIDDETEETTENFIIEFQLTGFPPTSRFPLVQATCSVEVWIMDDDIGEDDTVNAGGGDSSLVYATAGAAGGFVVVLSVIVTVVVAVTVTCAIKRKHLPAHHNAFESEMTDTDIRISTSDNKAYGIVTQHNALTATNELVISQNQIADEPEYDYIGAIYDTGSVDSSTA